MPPRWIFAIGLISVSLIAPALVRAQSSQRGRLIVTVADATGGVIPGATVTLQGLENATRATTLAPLRTTTNGAAIFEGLVPGRYTLTAVFDGFETGVVRELRVRTGDNRQTVALALERVRDQVVVGDRQENASDRGVAFGTALTREQIDALSDDPDELRRQLQQMAGPDAVIRVDSFEGQQLPPKSQIKSVRISRDQFSAENHFAGGIAIEIVTQPGVGPLRGNINTGFYTSALDGRNALVGARPATQNQSYGASVSGSLLKERSSFQVSVSASDSFTAPINVSATGSDITRATSALKTTTRSMGFSSLVDYALTRDQTLRVGFNRSGNDTGNQGIGGFNDPERAYATTNTNWGFRAQELGPLGRRFFTNTRFSLNGLDSSVTSATEAPTIVVLDSRTMGGAQMKGGTHNRLFNLASDLDYVRGRHAVRMGLLIDGGHYRSDQATNYLGTFTFVDWDAYLAGRPRSYTRRVGNPDISYWNVQTGMYILDDIRVSRNLTLTPGVRYEAQTHMPDRWNIGPRFGFTWAPFKSGRTTLRASAGVFYDWLPTGTYDQTLRIDGFRQQEVNLFNPSYPDPGSAAAPPINRYLLGEDLMMGRTMRLSAGINQQINTKLSAGVTYSYSRGRGQLVGMNLNAPENGQRPDPRFANIIETVSDGRSRQHSLSVNGSINLFGAGRPSTIRFFDPKRGLFVGGGYTIGRFENNTEGPFSPPASGSLAAEWGPAPGDVRHRLNLSMSSGMIRNFNMQISANGSSGSPLTLRTGTDDNGDLIFNDRPAGVGRNTLRVPGQWNSSGFFSYSFALGSKQVATGSGVQITSTGGQLSVISAGSQAIPRYRLNITLRVENLTNRANYVGYSGVITSPLFLKPTSVQGVRRIYFSVGASF